MGSKNQVVAIVHEFRNYTRYYVMGICSRELIVRSSTKGNSIEYGGCRNGTDSYMFLPDEPPLPECPACLAGLCSALKSGKLKQVLGVKRTEKQTHEP